MLILCILLLILAIVGLVIYYSSFEKKSSNYNEVRVSTPQRTTVYEENIVYTEPEILYEDPIGDIIESIVINEIEEEIIEDSYNDDSGDC